MATVRLVVHRSWLISSSVCAIVGLLAAFVATGAVLITTGDIWFRAALSFACVETAIAALLVPGLIWAKHIRFRNEETSARRQAQIEEWLAPGGELEQVRAAAVQWPEEFLSVLQRALSVFQGSERQRLAELARSEGRVPGLLQDCRSPNPNRAIRALRILSEIDDDACREAIRAAASHASPLARVAARRAILAGNDHKAKLDVLRGLAVAPLWERVVLYHAASSDTALLADFLRTAFESGRDELLLTALEMVHSRRCLTPCAVPASVAASPNTEVRIKFFKALAFFEIDGDLADVVRQGLCDDDWRVRAMAAQACARLHLPSLAEDLLRLCSVFDNPAEASHAARALAALGGEAQIRLERLASTQSAAVRGIAAEVVEAQWIKGAKA